jgi:hypothetical protein
LWASLWRCGYFYFSIWVPSASLCRFSSARDAVGQLFEAAGKREGRKEKTFCRSFSFFFLSFLKLGPVHTPYIPQGGGAVIVTEAHFDECINPKLIVGGELLMKKAILVAAILIAPSQSSYGADWQYDFRRCTVGHEVGDFYIRISSLYPLSLT